jgi:hypothetical protein
MHNGQHFKGQATDVIGHYRADRQFVRINTPHALNTELGKLLHHSNLYTVH